MNNLNLIAQKFRKNFNEKSKRTLTPIHEALYNYMKKNNNTCNKFDAIEALTIQRITERNIKDSDITEKIYAQNFTTVQNGFEAAICNGSTNAQINFNEKYDMKVVKVDNETYKLVNK